MQYNKVEISGVNTNELKTLKESEKLELLKKAHSGDKKAREELINGNLSAERFAEVCEPKRLP